MAAERRGGVKDSRISARGQKRTLELLPGQLLNTLKPRGDPMRSFLSLPIVLASGLLAACSPSEPGVPMEFSKACAVENDHKVVEMSGFLSASVTVFCSNRSGRMECAYMFTETPGAEKSISADIEQGSGSNSAEKLKSGYKREDIRIRDNAGNLINLAERVRLTGKLSVSPDLRACFMKVAKIQR